MILQDRYQTAGLLGEGAFAQTFAARDGQVAIDPKTGSPTALFDVFQWVRYPNGPTVMNTRTTGVLGDDSWPTLKYDQTISPDCEAL